MTEALGIPPIAVRSRAVLARALTAMGRLDEGLAFAREANEMHATIATTGMPGELDILMSLVEALEATGAVTEASEVALRGSKRVARMRAYFDDREWRLFSTQPHIARTLEAFERLSARTERSGG